MSKKGKKEEDVPPPPVFDHATYVQIVSADDHAFLMDRNCARISKLVKYSLAQFEKKKEEENAEAAQEAVIASSPATSGPVPLAAQNVIAYDDPTNGLPSVKIPFLSTEQLQYAAQFMHYKYKYDNDGPEHRTPWNIGSTRAEEASILSIATLLQI